MHNSTGICYRFLKPHPYIPVQYRGGDKSLARPGRKQAAPVKCVMEADWVDLARVGTGGGLL